MKGFLSHQNGAIAEYHGYKTATEELGQVGIQPPSNATAPGPDYITYDPKADTVVAWDAKYRSPGGTYPATVPAAKLAKWLPEVRNAINRLPAGALRDDALAALDRGGYRGQVYPYWK